MSIFFIGLLMFVILIQVFREGPVNAHRIAGSVAVYLLLGTLWGSIYFLIALHAPWSFQFTAGSVPAQPHALAAKFVYFSFITLTSVGYGDIVPVHPLAQTTATLEAIIGQLFPAILLARLVSLEIADRSSARPCGQDDPDSTGRSTE
ncbi:MAG: two pore domain potassium channel family protein [Deltaproteobacteria bacterium]|nr:two pore domain potassium channel family protein [Deltaproteobacteria bacterium]